MSRRLGRLCLVPLYLCAVVMLASWQDRLSLLSLPPAQGPLRPPPLAPAAELLRNNGTSGQTEAVEEGLRILGNDEPFTGINDSLLVAGERRTIMVWVGGFGNDHLGGCPDWQCRIVGRDDAAAHQADAVIFHNGVGSPPSRRKPAQYYVFFTQESPVHASVQEPYPSFYNLSMGFRRDADLPCPYGYAIRRPVPRTPQQMAEWSGRRLSASKSRMVAWFSSNCNAPSGRDAYVAELRKHVPVDVYGACGSLKCPKANMDHCLDKLDTDYRFYLAFENSICKDYITEKYWEKAATRKVIPVVLERAVVEPYAPPHSFLAADDFPSASAMAAEMKRLAAEPEAFAAFFAWKRDYDVLFLNGRVHDAAEAPWGFCRLCALLWQTPRPSRLRPRLQHWWRQEGACQRDELVRRLLPPS